MMETSACQALNKHCCHLCFLLGDRVPSRFYVPNLVIFTVQKNLSCSDVQVSRFFYLRLLSGTELFKSTAE